MVIRKIVNTKIKLLVPILIIIFFLITMAMLIVAILSQFKLSVDDECCKQNNATYVFYECQCNEALGLRCDNLTCGSYCRFADGHLENTNTIKCGVNETI
jgi:hypothetical protein